MSLFQSLRSFVDRIRPSVPIVRCEPAANSNQSQDEVAASTSTVTATPVSSTLVQLEPDTYVVYHVLGFPECPWFHRASCIAQDLERQSPYEEQIESLTWPIAREKYGAKLDGLQEFVPEIVNHNSCPAILETQCKRDDSAPDGVVCQQSTLVGGYAQLEQLLKKKYNFSSTYCDSLKQMTGNGGRGAC